MKKSQNNIVSITSATSTRTRKLTDEQRFKSHVAKRNANGCELWTGSIAQNGYGVFSVAGEPVYAHRYAYELANGPIPRGAYCCHHCDTRNCTRVSHLFLGDAKSNAVDKAQKGRSTKGRTVVRKKFTEGEITRIVEMAASGQSQYAISKATGRSQPVLAGVLKRNAKAIELKRIRLQFADALEALGRHLAPTIADVAAIAGKAA